MPIKGQSPKQIVHTCSECGGSAYKPTGHINRAAKFGYDLYCSRQCFGAAISRKQSKNYSLSYRNRQKEKLAGRPAPNRCEVCDGAQSANRNGAHRMHFDHCHNTGRFRGWICGPCNRIIGLAKDNADRLRALAGYLEKHHAN